MREPKFAICYSVKNEEKLLPHALEVARALGASRIYVFFDGTTDSTRQLVQGQDDILSFESIEPERLAHRPEWIDKIRARWSENMDVRKRINTYFAAQHAAADDIDWLLCIDPDEVMLPSLAGPLSNTSVRRFLAKMQSAGYGQVLLRNYEVVPRKADVENPFLECYYFKNRFSCTDFIWRASRALLRKWIDDPKKIAWFSYLFYSFRFFGVLPTLMRDPRTQKMIPAGYYLGYCNHKSFIRTSLVGDLVFDVHAWRDPAQKLRSKHAGVLLHFFLYDVESVLQKFRTRPVLNSFKGYDFYGAEISRIAREYTHKEFRQFFLDYISISDAAFTTKLEKRGILLSVRNLSELIKRNQATYLCSPSKFQ